MSNLLKEFEGVKNKVAFLLKNYKSLRGNDMKLWISYLVMYHNLQASLKGGNPFDAFCVLVMDDRVPGMESIRRVRQKLQENGEYPKDKKADKTGEKKHSVKERVEALLKANKPLRDDDKKLWLAYLISYHDLKNRLNNSDDPYETLCDVLIEDVPAIESIRRCRQVLQENGLYLGDKRREKLAAAKKVAKRIVKS